MITISQPSITNKEIDYVTDAIKSGWVSSLGEYINRFEKQFAEYCGVKYALTTCNGTVALHLALASLGVGEGDEVIVPDLTFIATANAVLYTGAKVVTVDIDEETLCIDPTKLAAAINSKTKAIIPVHLYGQVAEMQAINEIAKKHNLYVVEDAAEAHGAEIQGKKAGSFADAAIFSFYGNKIITSGEGGMITTDNEKLYQKMKYLRDHAMSQDKRYWHTEVGFNYRMTNLQAALGVAQLERIEELIAMKKQVFDWYYEELKAVEILKLNCKKEGYKNVYWMVAVEVIGFDQIQRDELLQKLKKAGIDNRPYFYPISDMPMYPDADTPITHKVYQRGFNLPSHAEITQKDVVMICNTLKSLLNV